MNIKGTLDTQGIQGTCRFENLPVYSDSCKNNTLKIAHS